MRPVPSFVLYSFLSFLIVLSGCSGTTRPVRATPSELRQLPTGEGVVIGSVAIRAGSKGDNTTSVLYGLKGEQWAVAIAKTSDLETVRGRMALHAMESYAAGQLKAVEGEEQSFVMPLPAGEYLFWSMSRSMLTGTMSAPLRIPFRVSSGKTKYIGRLVVEMPAKVNTVLGIPTGVGYKVMVEDARDETINALGKEYGALFVNVERDLMGQALETKLPGGSIADARLQQNALSAVWIMDTASDNTCSQRKVVDTAVSITGQHAGVDPWTEKWTVDRCGKQIDYLVEFSPSPQGGTDFSVKAGAEPGK